MTAWERAEGERLGGRDILLLMLVAIALLAPGIASLPPVDRDEPRYAVASTEMLAHRDFVDIRYQDQPRYLQPVGIYWLQILPTALFSSPDHRAIWTYRIPSLLGALAAALITAFAATRLFGRGVGVSAGVFLAACLSLGFEARIAKTDAALLAAVSVAQFALMRLYLRRDASRWVAAAFWAALGVGILLKGPIVLLVAGLTTAALCLWDRRVGWLEGLRASWGVPLALLIAAPWYVAIGLRSHGAFYGTAIGRSMMGKVAAGQQAHGAPFGYHLVGFPLTFWPASLLAVAAVPFAWRHRREPAVRFLIAWIAPSWIVFEAIKTKLPHYVLPLFPALACLAALALFSPKVSVKPWVRWIGVAFVAVWIVLSGALTALGPAALWIYEKRIDAVAVALTIAALIAVGVLVWGLSKRNPGLVTGAVAAASLFTALNLYVVSLPRLGSLWISPKVERLVAQTAPCPAPPLVTTPFHEPSLVFLHGPTRTTLAENPVEAADRLAASGACGVALIGEKQQPAFLAEAQTTKLPLRVLGEVQGRDYADGSKPHLTLYARAAPAAAQPPGAPK